MDYEIRIQTTVEQATARKQRKTDRLMRDIYLERTLIKHSILNKLREIRL